MLRQKWSRGQVEARLANIPRCLIGMEACVGAHHLSRKLKALGHDARLMPAKYVRPYSKGQKNDFRDAGEPPPRSAMPGFVAPYPAAHNRRPSPPNRPKRIILRRAGQAGGRQRSPPIGLKEKSSKNIPTPPPAIA